MVHGTEFEHRVESPPGAMQALQAFDSQRRERPLSHQRVLGALHRSLCSVSQAEEVGGASQEREVCACAVKHVGEAPAAAHTAGSRTARPIAIAGREREGDGEREL
eukprot:scaffold147934_cov32-Tisochrysis_lutea.AAC.2